MTSTFMGHEVVRRVMQTLDSFTPPPRGGWGWMLRTRIDIGVAAMRAILGCYYTSGDLRTFMAHALRLVRL